MASRSPQRLALLEGLGLEVEVIVSGVEEVREGDPLSLVEENAKAKALAVRDKAAATGRPVIGGDTEVVVDGVVLGKPGDREQAATMLERLSGREHTVAGGLCVLTPDASREPLSGVELTTVEFRELSRDEIERYLDGSEWKGRAGGYAIQGAGSALVKRVEGDLSNVIGLPLGLLARLAPELLRATRQN